LALIQGHDFSRLQISGYDLERYPTILEILPANIALDEGLYFLAANQAFVQARVGKDGQDPEPIGAQRHLFDGLDGHSSSVKATEHGTHAGTSDEINRNTVLFQDLEDANVRQSPSTATA
jgi:hypothetical protein